ncbi:hypothetical protein OX283_000855 [Flavobacterium sp. SUN052]|uniref:hypothetical protein n=1 Tax=Flavobacterium sp. SUN052 TaxID=3002441 RepID=UPI00237E51DD|nr:hypothetical protein [Flavobacterium sp. SUN052]MEC4003190.1 hypothetical protein [Flavobacterium sp. SUN052]
MKKNLVLFVLFILPIVAYLFFASGINSFAKLPTITKTIPEINTWKTLDNKPVALSDKITILGFIGEDVLKHKGNFFNLYEKIYARNKDFKDFQMVMILPDGTQEQVKELQKDLIKLGTQAGWNFVFGSPEEIKLFYDKLHLVGKLDAKLGTPNVYIIDKKRNLRGRKGQDKKGKTEYKEGYNTVLVGDLYNQMTDDVKIILAEYRLALKRNHNATREIGTNEK